MIAKFFAMLAMVTALSGCGSVQDKWLVPESDENCNVCGEDDGTTFLHKGTMGHTYRAVYNPYTKRAVVIRTRR